MKDKFSYVKELIKQSKEEYKNEVLTNLSIDGEVVMSPTKKAEEARRILKETKLYITLEEMQALEKQATEESKEILGISEVVITPEEMQELEKQATETRPPKDEKFARAIRELSISGEEPKIPTDKAREAKRILEKAELVINLKEMQDLEKQASEIQQPKDDPVSRAIRDLRVSGEEPKIPTDKAKEAKRILGKAKLHITVEEMQDLEKQASEIQQPKDDPVSRAIRDLRVSGEEPKIPTDRAIQAQKILNKDNLEVVLGEARERIVFTPEEIGKGTLVQQGKTMEKKQEENTRAEMQLQQEESLGKE